MASCIGDFDTDELVWWHAAFGDALEDRREALITKHSALVEQQQAAEALKLEIATTFSKS